MKQLINEIDELINAIELRMIDRGNDVPLSLLQQFISYLRSLKDTLNNGKYIELPQWGRAITDIWPLNDSLANRLLSFERKLDMFKHRNSAPPS